MLCDDDDGGGGDQVMLLAAWLSADARRRQCTVAVSLMTICLSDLCETE